MDASESPVKPVWHNLHPAHWRLRPVGLLLASLGAYLCLLMGQEWQFRQQFWAAPLPPMPAVQAAPAPVPLDATAVATLFGLNPKTALLASAEALTLQASFVRRLGLSSALLADAQGVHRYQVGERLPGGSVLRRIETDQVVLWNKGREERLRLQGPATPFLRRVDAASGAASALASPRFFRPLSGPSQ